MQRLAILLLALVATSIHASAQAQSIFVGVPVLKISEGGLERTPEKLSAHDATNLKCVVSKIGDNYYWASRQNKSLRLEVSGAYMTFVASDGSGYVRVQAQLSAEARATLPSTEQQFDYVEHMLLGLRSVTYYGMRSK